MALLRLGSRKGTQDAPDAGAEQQREQIGDDDRVEDLARKDAGAAHFGEADAVAVGLPLDAATGAARMHKLPLSDFPNTDTHKKRKSHIIIHDDDDRTRSRATEMRRHRRGCSDTILGMLGMSRERTWVAADPAGCSSPTPNRWCSPARPRPPIGHHTEPMALLETVEP